MSTKVVSGISSFLSMAPGRHRTGLDVPRLAQSVKVRLPLLAVVGRRSGPLAVVMAGQHGRELNGLAAIERVFNALNPGDLKGRVVFLPVMNPLAVLARRQDYPVEEFRYRKMGVSTHHALRHAGAERNYNMDASWIARPAAGTYAIAVAETVWGGCLRHADFSIDLHAWSDASIPLAWGFRRHARWVRAFGMPYHQLRAPTPDQMNTGMAAARVEQAGIPHIMVELPPQNILDAASVELGRRGIINCLKHAGMLRGVPQLPDVQYEFRLGDRETSIIVEAEGLLIAEIERGGMARRGQVVARVISLDTFDTIWTFRAPHDGMVVSNGRAFWGEDARESAIVYPGLKVGLLRKVGRVIHN